MEDLVIKNILFKAAERTGVELTLVANQAVSIPSSDCIKIGLGFDSGIEGFRN